MMLSLHNLARWVVLILGIVAAFRSYTGISIRKEWTSLDSRSGRLFALTMDIQFLLGLAIYFYLSPITRDTLNHFGAPFQNTERRFFSLIHVLYMGLALVFTHLGTTLPRKADNSLVKHQRAATFFTLAVFCLLLGTPWARPLFPGL